MILAPCLSKPILTCNKSVFILYKLQTTSHHISSLNNTHLGLFMWWLASLFLGLSFQLENLPFMVAVISLLVLYFILHAYSTTLILNNSVQPLSLFLHFNVLSVFLILLSHNYFCSFLRYFRFSIWLPSMDYSTLLNISLPSSVDPSDVTDFSSPHSIFFQSLFFWSQVFSYYCLWNPFLVY